MNYKEDSIQYDISEYYSILDIAAILLSDVCIVEDKINDRDLWNPNSLVILDNPMEINNEKYYHMSIMCELDKLINIENMTEYKRNYQDRISSILDI